MSSGFTLLPSRQYLEDATRAVRHAKHRVYLLNFVLLEDDVTSDFFAQLAKAAQRGLEVVVTADSNTFAEAGGYFRPHFSFSGKLRPATALRQKLQQSGAKFFWVGQEASVPFSGRTHTKWLVVDETVYSFGGTNLYKGGVESNDFMLKKTDEQLAGRLVHEHKRILKSVRARHAYRSHSFGDDTSQVLIDGGFVGDSIIYRRACKLAAEASHTVYVSQFCPGGRLGKLLKKSHASLYFNPWQQASHVNSLLIRTSSFLSGNKTLYTRPTYLHCKFMIYTMPNGEKVALTGSHNFARGGVWFGTREIALETRDKHVIHQLEQYVKTNIS